jgi:hypothetical protein
MCVEGNKVVQPSNKCQNVTPIINSYFFFGSKTLYKKQDEI